MGMVKREITVTVSVVSDAATYKYDVVDALLDRLTGDPDLAVSWNDSLRFGRVSSVVTDTVGEAVPVAEPNRERLLKLAQWAAGQHALKELGLPSEWNQGAWLTYVNGELTAMNGCGTACCIAGKVAMEDGGVPVGRVYDSELEDYRLAVGTDGVQAGRTFDFVAFPVDGALPTITEMDEAIEDGVAVGVSDYARKALGLSSRQANELFSGSNDLARVLDVIRQILSGEWAADE